MLTNLRLENFKSWSDTGNVRLAPITCFFGANSSGKTSLSQSLLLLKQTAESSDRKAVLQFGGPGNLVNLGDFASVVHDHVVSKTLRLSLGWDVEEDVELANPLERKGAVAAGKSLSFSTAVAAENGQGKAMRLRVEALKYTLDSAIFEMVRRQVKRDEYDLKTEVPGFQFTRTPGRAWPLPAPIKCYGFPDQVRGYFQNAGFLSDLELQLEEMLRHIFYLGPLRA
jgi:predicted ATPase